eukprot:975017-Rhodomonas_salina.2
MCEERLELVRMYEQRASQAVRTRSACRDPRARIESVVQWRIAELFEARASVLSSLGYALCSTEQLCCLGLTVWGLGFGVYG